VQEDFRLIIDLVTVLAAAATGGIIAGLCRQPALLGYILGGVIVGPTGLGLIKELIQVETLAQFGAAFLLFALGVEFSFAELKKVQNISLGGGGLQILLTIGATTFISVAIGWVTTPQQGVFLGSILSLSSTAVVLKCLMEANETETPHGQVMLGMLVVQDLALGFMLAILPALDKPPAEIGEALLQAGIKIALFSAAAIITGIWVVPRFLRLLAQTESRELFLLGVVTLCLAIALLTAQLGLSIEMGAFVAGLMISEVEYADQTLTYVEPLRDVFAALFFAAIGMLIDPLFLLQNWELILGLVGIVLVGKWIIITPIVRLFGYPLKTAITVGLGLAQIGEFSFVLASEGQSLGFVSRRVYLLLLGTTAVTLVITPLVLKLTPKLFSWLESFPQLKSWFEDTDEPQEVSIESNLNGHVVICGYGRTGQNILHLLQTQAAPVVVIEQSEASIQKLRDLGIPYIYGNAASLHVLAKANLGQAKTMVINLPDGMSTRLCLKRALEIAPELDVVVRANQFQDIELLYQLGGKEVVQPEFEASLEMASHLLYKLGLPVVKVQQEISQIRNSHYLELRPAPGIETDKIDVEAATVGMSTKWFNIPVISPLSGMSIEEANIRSLTGITILSIRRENGDELPYPSEDTLILDGDRCLVVGSADEKIAFKQLVRGKIALPMTNAACQWLVIPPASMAIGLTLSALDTHRQYGVQIRALRRATKFIDNPDQQTTVIMAGDRLLLCGGRYPLTKLQQQLTTEHADLIVATDLDVG
jgi:monovalent cation:H+ antiporter-2, CPA2 family